MTSARRRDRRPRLPARFLALLAVAGLLAFLVGTQFLSTPVRRFHAVTGRPIPGMATDAAWMDRAERQAEENPDRALALIGITPGMTVADIGAGTGYITLRLAPLVGPAGIVYANEIQPDMLQRIAGKLRDQRVDNVRLVLGAPDDARLPENAIDVALLVDVYHELQFPQAMLRSIHRSLKADGRLILIEYREEDRSLPIAATHRMSVSGLRREIEPVGFAFASDIEELPRQHVVVFRRT